MPGCTEFCERLNTILLRDGVLPSYDDLVVHLGPTNQAEKARWPLGQWPEIQARAGCAFCQLVSEAICRDTQNELHGRTVSSDQQIDVVMFPGEASFRLSYPSRLGTQIAFIAEQESQVVSPNNAREYDCGSLDMLKIRAWIETCNREHTDCVRHGKNKQQNYSNDEPRQGSFGEATFSNFRVLDLVEDMVRQVALDTRYVTLSYVWGQTPTVLLQQDNKDILTAPGGLAKIREKLPKTINDAIDFVRDLGERYLWIDALCLLQDDAHDVELGVSMMHSIYQGSYLTLVIASGSDANAGIPRLESASAQDGAPRVKKTLSSGLSMTIVRSIDWHLARSVYNQRGWTLQELVLPPRSLIFVDGRAYFRCQEANWAEETWADRWTSWLDDDDSNISRIPDWSESRLASLWAYQKLCEDYSMRRLRSDGDAVRAMAGVTRQLFSGMQTAGLEGLPAYYLDVFLLFSSCSADMRRRDRFASFSWAGWEGRILFPRENYTSRGEYGKDEWQVDNILEWIRKSRLVNWKRLTTSGTSGNLTSFRTTDRIPIHHYREEFPNVVWGECEKPQPRFAGSEYTGVVSGSADAPDWDAEDATNPAGTANSLSMLDAVDGEAEYERIVSGMSDVRMRLALANYMTVRRLRINEAQNKQSGTEFPPLKSRHLETMQYQFRSARLPPDSPEEKKRLANDGRVKARKLQLERKNPDMSEAEREVLLKASPIPKFPPYTILEFQTVSLRLKLGLVPSYTTWQANKSAMPNMFDRVPPIPLLGRTGSVCGWLHPDNVGMLPASGCDIELVVLSRSHAPTTGSPWRHDAVVDDNGSEQGSPARKLLWVLAIAWEEGIAERRGVGQVYEMALADAVEPLPEFKTIRLG